MNKEELLYEIATKNNELIEKNNKIIDLQQENRQLKDKYNKVIKEINRINNIDVNDYYETLVCKELAIEYLNDEIEIIEEPKKIEKLDYRDEAYIDSAIERIFFVKINQIIEYLNEKEGDD